MIYYNILVNNKGKGSKILVSSKKVGYMIICSIMTNLKSKNFYAFNIWT